jgi:hypothetical protein
MASDVPSRRGVLVALRLLVALMLAGLAGGLLLDVRVEEIDLDCGFAPVAAVTHDSEVCRVEGRNQSFGAAAAAAAALALCFAPRLDRRRKAMGPLGPGAADPSSALDADASAEIRAYRRRAWTAVGAAVGATVMFTIFAVEADRDEPLAVNQRHAVVTAIDASRTQARVAFESGGQAEQADVVVDASRRLTVGDGVTVELGGAKPGAVRLVDPESGGPWWPVLGWLGSLVGLALGAVVLWRSRRTAAILSAGNWSRLTRVEAGPVSSEHWVGYEGGRVLRALPAARWRSRPLKQAGTIAVAGPRAGLVVVRVPTHPTLLLARSTPAETAAGRPGDHPVGAGGASGPRRIPTRAVVICGLASGVGWSVITGADSSPSGRLGYFLLGVPIGASVGLQYGLHYLDAGPGMRRFLQAAGFVVAVGYLAVVIGTLAR